MASKNRTIVRVRDTDRGWNKLRREIFGIGRYVTVGVHGEDDSRKGGEIGNVELMAVHEFGTKRAGPNNDITIPERSVIRYTIDKMEMRYRSLIKTLGNRVYTVRLTTKAALELLGLKVASDMRQTMARTPGSWEGLKASTLRGRKSGGTKPLMDTLELQRAIKHKVHP